MLPSTTDLADMQLPKSFPKLRCHPDRRSHCRVNLSGVSEIKAKLRFGHACEQLMHFCERAPRGFPVVHVFKAQPRTQRLPKSRGLDELRVLRDENKKLKQVVADLTLDKQILREALGKKF